MKKRKNGRTKGNSFERLVAKLLSNWWDEEFHRTPSSGGLHWKRDNRVTGDVVTPENSNFPFSIECKKVEGWNFEQLLKDTGEIKSWWCQCFKDSEEVGKIPLLIFSKNRSPIYYMTTKEVAEIIFESSEQKNFFITKLNTFGADLFVFVGILSDLCTKNKEEVIKKLL